MKGVHKLQDALIRIISIVLPVHTSSMYLPKHPIIGSLEGEYVIVRIVIIHPY
jgi:hypothetical protein